jgi:hypothetical protein
VLWRAFIAEWEGSLTRSSGLATRYMSTIQRVPNGVGVGVLVCWSGGKKMFASLGRV